MPWLRNFAFSAKLSAKAEEACMNQLIYLVGLIVVILAVLSFFGLR